MSKQVQAAHSAKLKRVRIGDIRVPEAGVCQRPFSKAHGDDYASNLDLHKLGIPTLNYRDGVYWAIDGQHRVYALIQNGFEADVLECEVFEGLTDSEAANIFLGRNGGLHVTPFSKFLVSCTAGYEAESDIKRTVESVGLKLSISKSDRSICAVSALMKVYTSVGAAGLAMVLRVLKRAFDGDAYAFDGHLIQGVGMVVARYGAKVDEPVLANALSMAQFGARGLLRRAQSTRERTGNRVPICVAAVVVEQYNKRVKAKLPAWWKEQAA